MNEIAQKRKLNYIPSLDGLRGLFCILIIVNHWRLMLPIVPVGWEVLQAFFVMSGFLITRILLHERDKHTSFKSYIKSFYLKRTLRIFPLYFLFLIFWGVVRLLLTNSEFIQTMTQDLAQNWGYYFTYTSNLKSLFNPQEVDSPFFVHLWSLGLEEQFYLIMPFLIYYLKGNKLKAAVIVVILIPFITRPLGYHYLSQINDNPIWTSLLVYRNLPFQCDAFALGGAVAIFDFKFIRHPKRWFYLLLAVMIGLNVWHYRFFADFAIQLMAHFNVPFDESGINAFWYINMLGHPEVFPMNNQHNYMMPLINFMCFLMVLTSVRGNTLWPVLFENKYFVRIGKVTYGMYVFHFFVIIVFLKGAAKLLGGGNVYGNPILAIPLFIVYIFILYLMSEFSFKYIEGPFLKLKNKLR